MHRRPQRLALLSVDVWDTLLRRACHPDAVKRHLALHLLRRHAAIVDRVQADAGSLLRLRLAVEHDLAHASRAGGGDGEYTHHEVLREWLRRLSSIDHDAREALIAPLAAEEFAQERRVSFADPGIAAVLGSLPAQRRVFLSDFYLPAARLHELLALHGLADLFDEGFSSSDHGLNKGSGRLFTFLQNRHRLRPVDCGHLGDDAVKDVARPRALGWWARRYRSRDADIARRTQTRWLDSPSTQAKAVLAAARACAPQIADAEAARTFDLGLRLAPLVAGFLLFIHETLCRRPVDRLFFLTREGEFFLRGWNRLREAAPQLGLPPADLLQVSRLATFCASLHDGSPEELRVRLWSAYDPQSMRAWARSLNLPEARIEELAVRQALPFDEAIARPWTDSRVQALLREAECREIIGTAIERQRAGLHGYLAQAGFPARGKVALADIGWHGSIQNNLARLFPQTRIDGYYLGLQRALEPAPANTARQAFGPELDRDPADAELFADLPLMETICGSARGSVLGYTERDGRFEALRREDPAASAVFDAVVRPVQEGALHGIGLWAEAIATHALGSADLRPPALQAWRDLLRRPPAAILHAYRESPHDEWFGRGRITPGREFDRSVLQRWLRTRPRRG